MGTSDIASDISPTASDMLVLRAFIDSDWGGEKIGWKSIPHSHSCSGECKEIAVKSRSKEFLLGNSVCLELYSDSVAGMSSRSQLGLGKLEHVRVRYKVEGQKNSADLCSRRSP